jgi:hypothetical protein
MRCTNCYAEIRNTTPYDSHAVWVHDYSGDWLCYPTTFATPEEA